MQQTLYRIWRPKKFDEVIGQKDIIRVLTNEIKMDRISHAYLFVVLEVQEKHRVQEL